MRTEQTGAKPCTLHKRRPWPTRGATKASAPPLACIGDGHTPCMCLDCFTRTQANAMTDTGLHPVIDSRALEAEMCDAWTIRLCVVWQPRTCECSAHIRIVM